MKDIYQRCKEILSRIPEGVIVEAATKTRSPEEIKEAIRAGISVLGENYVQEAKAKIPLIEDKVEWHLIGHLQKNKAKYAVKLFDMIETVDSVELATEINKRCKATGTTMDILIQVNIGLEESKSGVNPDSLEELIRSIAALEHLRIKGLMTIEPFEENPEDSRKYFKRMKALFEDIKKLNIENVEMKYLSMGISHNYMIAIEEGANIVRIGTAIFGPRTYKK